MSLKLTLMRAAKQVPKVNQKTKGLTTKPPARVKDDTGARRLIP